MKKYFLTIILFFSQVMMIFPQFTDTSNDVITIPQKKSYLDIRSVNVESDHNYITVTLIMNGDIPQSNYYETVSMEWDIMIDIDQNPATMTWRPWSESVNDIGVEYMIGFKIHRDKLEGRFFNKGSEIDKTIPVKVDKNKIIIKLKNKELENVDAFDFVVLARKYVGYGNANALVYYDKMPNRGHFTFFVNENKTVYKK